MRVVGYFRDAAPNRLPAQAGVALVRTGAPPPGGNNFPPTVNRRVLARWNGTGAGCAVVGRFHRAQASKLTPPCPLPLPPDRACKVCCPPATDTQAVKEILRLI